MAEREFKYSEDEEISFQPEIPQNSATSIPKMKSRPAHIPLKYSLGGPILGFVLAFTAAQALNGRAGFSTVGSLPTPVERNDVNSRTLQSRIIDIDNIQTLSDDFLTGSKDTERFKAEFSQLLSYMDSSGISGFTNAVEEYPKLLEKHAIVLEARKDYQGTGPFNVEIWSFGTKISAKVAVYGHNMSQNQNKEEQAIFFLHALTVRRDLEEALKIDPMANVYQRDKIEQVAWQKVRSNLPPSVMISLRATNSPLLSLLQK